MKGKPRNQRLSSSKVRKQQHILEVTIRRDKAVAMRNRAITAFICKTLVFATLAAGAWIGGKEALRRFLWENPDYFLTDLRVTPTDGAVTREQVLQTAGIVEGRNIFTFDLAAARAELDKLPQVERAEIQRVLPNRIDITITERRPIAWVTQRANEDPTASEKAFLIDARGVVMRSKILLPEYRHLPTISGVAIENLVPGQRVNSFEMRAALDLVRLNGDNTHWEALNIDLSKGYCLVVTDRNHSKITFGLKDIAKQLDRLFRYLDLIRPMNKEILTVNLMVERNTPITFAPIEGEVPESSPTLVAPKTAAPVPVKTAQPVAKSATPAPFTKPFNAPASAAATPAPSGKTKPGTFRKPFRLNP